MTINEVNTIQDLMNMDIEVKMAENVLTLVKTKEFITLLIADFPEEGFNITNFLRDRIKDTIKLIESDELVDSLDNIPLLKEILTIL